MVNCPKCGSSNVQSRGYNQNRDKKRFECQENHSRFVDENDNDYRWFSLPIEMTVEKSKNAPKILIWDVETHIDKAWLFSHGKQYVHGTSFENEVSLICWSAKWLGSPETFGDVQTSKEAKNKDDKRVVTSLWKAMSEADIHITHNGKRFDELVMNTRFLIHKLGLPKRTFSIDTYAVAKQNFKLRSYSLDYICNLLGLNTGKIKTDVNLWKGCYEGNQEDLDYMFKYNLEDSNILEDVYHALRPYMTRFPNIGVWSDVEVPVCPYCGGTNFEDNGHWYTPNGKFNSYRCECQALFRSKDNLLSKKKKSVNLIGI